MHGNVVGGRPQETLLATEDSSQVPEFAIVTAFGHLQCEGILAFPVFASGLVQTQPSPSRLERLDFHRPPGAYDLETAVRPAEGVVKSLIDAQAAVGEIVVDGGDERQAA